MPVRVVHVTTRDDDYFAHEQHFGRYFGRLLRQLRRVQTHVIHGTHLSVPRARFAGAMRATSCTADPVLLHSSDERLLATAPPLLTQEVSEIVVTHDARTEGWVHGPPMLIVRFRDGAERWLPLHSRPHAAADAGGCHDWRLVELSDRSGDPHAVVRVDLGNGTSAYVLNRRPFGPETIFRDGDKCYQNRPRSQPNPAQCPAAVPFLPAVHPRVHIVAAAAPDHYYDLELRNGTQGLFRCTRTKDGDLVFRLVEESLVPFDFGVPRVLEWTKPPEDAAGEGVRMSEVVRFRGPRIQTLSGLAQHDGRCVTREWSPGLIAYRRYRQRADDRPADDISVFVCAPAALRQLHDAPLPPLRRTTARPTRGVWTLASDNKVEAENGPPFFLVKAFGGERTECFLNIRLHPDEGVALFLAAHLMPQEVCVARGLDDKALTLAHLRDEGVLGSNEEATVVELTRHVATIRSADGREWTRRPSRALVAPQGSAMTAARRVGSEVHRSLADGRLVRMRVFQTDPVLDLAPDQATTCATLDGIKYVNVDPKAALDRHRVITEAEPEWTTWWDDLFTLVALDPSETRARIVIDPAIDSRACRQAAVAAAVRVAEMCAENSSGLHRHRPVFDDRRLEAQVVARLSGGG